MDLMGSAHACPAAWTLLWLVCSASPAEVQVAGRQASERGWRQKSGARSACCTDQLLTQRGPHRARQALDGSCRGRAPHSSSTVIIKEKSRDSQFFLHRLNWTEERLSSPTPYFFELLCLLILP